MKITLDVAKAGEGDLTVSLSQDGFSGLSGLHGTDVWNGDTTSTLSKAAYWGTSLFDLTNEFFSETGFTGVFDEEFLCSGPITDDGSIALTLVWGIHVSDSGETEFTAGNNRFSIPEPAMLGLFGVGLLGFAVLARRRQRRGQTKT